MLVKLVAKDFLKVRPQPFPTEQFTEKIRADSVFQEEVMKYIWIHNVSEEKACKIAHCMMHSDRIKKK